MAPTQSNNIGVFDPTARLCADTCRAVIGETVMYTDDNHISAQGTLLFKEDLLSIAFSR
jgi:hypothetical protein